MGKAKKETLRFWDQDRDGATPSFCKCGRANGFRAESTESQKVGLKRETLPEGQGRRAKYTGILSCKSPWHCPVCAARQAAKRASVVETVFSAVEEKDGIVLTFALTAHHSNRHTLREVMDLVGGASRKTRQGKAYYKKAKAYHVKGSLVGPELTISRETGNHYHQHIGIIFVPPREPGDMTDYTEKAKEFGQWFVDTYIEKVRKLGGKASHKGQHFSVAMDPEQINYLAKGSGAWEIAAAGQGKQTKTGTSYTPWDILEMASQGDEWARHRWREYVKEFKRVQSCVVSPQLKKALDLPQDINEGVEQEDDGRTVEDITEVEPAAWNWILQQGHVPALTSLIESKVAVSAISRWVDHLVIGYCCAQIPGYVRYQHGGEGWVYQPPPDAEHT